MRLTGQCKTDFENWYNGKRFRLPFKTEEYSGDGLGFNDLPDSMQWGVLQRFMDFSNIRIDIVSKWTELKTGEPVLIYELFVRGEVESPWETRPQARTAAVEKLNEFYNNQNL